MITITLQAPATVDAVPAPRTKKQMQQPGKTSQMGLEPTIFGSGNRRLIHLATGTEHKTPPVGLEPTISPLGGVRLIH